MSTVTTMHKQSPHSPVHLYDTTLRDGSQRKGLSFSLEDKLKIARLLDNFGVSYIEGGWPGSNPKDMEFFRRVRQLGLRNSKVAAFGSTCRVGSRPEGDANLQAILEARTDVVTIVGKSSLFHVQHVLQTSAEENLRLIRDSVAFLKGEGLEVIFDAEHFFDGYAQNAAYTVECVGIAAEAGADWVVLCDTNGGTLPGTVYDVVSRMVAEVTPNIGIHCHNDAEVAVANSIAAVQAGARQVQGTINGYGERCGNANLVSLVPPLQMKLGFYCVPQQNIVGLTELSRTVAEVANLSPDPHAPYVGASAFAHKAGLHVAAVEKVTSSYEHVDPESVGNARQIVVSELSGRGNIRMHARQAGVSTNGREQDVLCHIKQMEEQGYQFEGAEGTVELMVRRTDPDYTRPFELVDMMVVVSHRELLGMSAEAVVKVRVGNVICHTAAEGTGPVNALDRALRKALQPSYPHLVDVRLADYKVRILDPEAATEATTRVFVEAAHGDERWATVGCSPNIIDASYQALADSLELFILRNCSGESGDEQIKAMSSMNNNSSAQEVVA